MAELINNRAHRIQQLKEIITQLHEGVGADAVRQQLKDLVQQTDASEIAEMEQALMNDGMPTAKVMAMCDLHAEVVRDILVDQPGIAVAPGHPVDTFRRENVAIADEIDRFRDVLKDLLGRDGDSDLTPDDLVVLRKHFAALMDIEKHYSRKENLLFPMLEKHDISGPSKVMWGKDDEVRVLLKGVDDVLQENEITIVEFQVVDDTLFEPAFKAVEEMIRKEEDILLPMSQGALTESEWGEIWMQTPEIGYCLVDPREGYEPPKADLLTLGAPAPAPDDGRIVFPTGSLSLAQVKGVFDALPVDITFVDRDDRVRYFSDDSSRIFVRPKAIIGRKVQHCHPPASVDTVERIVSDFRSGKESSCSFWLSVKERFVLIRYFAVRDEKGSYLGTLEVTQDLTDVRALEGERRLLQYDAPEMGDSDG